MHGRVIDGETSVSRPGIAARWPVIAGLAVLAVPTLVSMARQHWSTEAGAHGPLVIATAGWLIWRDLQSFDFTAKPGKLGIAMAMLLPSLAAYAFGRAFGFLSVECVGLYGAAAASIYALYGGHFLRHLGFPLFYLAFAIPLPGWLIDYATAPLKQLASVLTTHFLQLFGVPIVRQGVTLFVAQYELLVEDACAGMNAIMGLTSLGLFYGYVMHRSSWRYSLLLAAFILPIAVLANVVRIIILVLITLYWGNAAAQGYLHSTAGLVMFATALLGVFAVDTLLTRLRMLRKQSS